MLTLATAGLMAATFGVAHAAGNPSDLDVLSGAANAYAANNLSAVYKGADVHDRVVTIPHGTAYGQSLHPSTDALKTMAFLPATANGGDVTLDFVPAGCNRGSSGSCDLLVHTTVEGVTRTFAIHAR